MPKSGPYKWRRLWGSGVLVSLTLNILRQYSEISIIGGGDHFGRGVCYEEDYSMGNNNEGF